MKKKKLSDCKQRRSKSGLTDGERPIRLNVANPQRSGCVTTSFTFLVLFSVTAVRSMGFFLYLFFFSFKKKERKETALHTCLHSTGFPPIVEKPKS